MVDHDPRPIDPSVKTNLNILNGDSLTITPKASETDCDTSLRSGRRVWRGSGYSINENDKLVIRNCQSIFLARFPEFNQRFPRDEKDQVSEDQREQAKQFILEKIGTLKKFRAELGHYLVKQPLLKPSFWITFNTVFAPWGIPFNYQRMPDGWISFKNLAKELHKKQDRSRGPVSRLADLYKLEHPEWFKEYIVPNGTLQECLAPELVVLIKSSLPTERDLMGVAPEGWLNINAVAKQLHRSNETISKNAEKYRQDHPDWFKNCLSTGRYGFGEHLSPLLIAELKRILSDSEIKVISPEEANEKLMDYFEEAP